jgi:hypothetical protein
MSDVLPPHSIFHACSAAPDPEEPSPGRPVAEDRETHHDQSMNSGHYRMQWARHFHFRPGAHG